MSFWLLLLLWTVCVYQMWINTCVNLGYLDLLWLSEHPLNPKYFKTNIYNNIWWAKDMSAKQEALTFLWAVSIYWKSVKVQDESQCPVELLVFCREAVDCCFKVCFLFIHFHFDYRDHHHQSVTTEHVISVLH